MEILRSVSVPVPFYIIIPVFIFAAWAKLFYARGTVKKTVKRTLYVCKAGARKLLISKELPISKIGDCLATTPSAIF